MKLMKEKVEFNFILPYDLISFEFSGATIITEINYDKIRRENEIKHRKDKIKKIKYEINYKGNRR